MKSCPEDVVLHAMRPIVSLEVPEVLRTNIERQARTLMELTTNLLYVGMDEHEVTCVINQACGSFRAELVSAIISLRRAP
jgi:hypothetical protein